MNNLHVRTHRGQCILHQQLTTQADYKEEAQEFVVESYRWIPGLYR